MKPYSQDLRARGQRLCPTGADHRPSSHHIQREYVLRGQALAAAADYGFGRGPAPHRRPSAQTRCEGAVGGVGGPAAGHHAGRTTGSAGNQPVAAQL
jgi:hypothetical protein